MHDSFDKVDCRIGSLEMTAGVHLSIYGVDCRIGSLEKMCNLLKAALSVDCRIGSLETADVATIETLNCISGNI